MNHNTPDQYYIPHNSFWPITGCIGLGCTLVGFANWLHINWFGSYLFFLGLTILFFMLVGWFSQVVIESRKGLYNQQVDHSYRIAMIWFIFSEVCFFATFFGAFFFIKFVVVPALGGSTPEISLTHYMLWPNFKAAWPLLVNPDPNYFISSKSAMYAWGIPALNTLILLSSGVTITFAHWGFKLEKRSHIIIGLALTIALGITFLCMQAFEYHDAYTDLHVTLNSGVYGATFFLLTGFHGAHVTIGTIFLIVVFLRVLKGHFSTHKHFAFEAAAWYWHFVDVVWLFLFIFVYWL